MSAVVYNGLRPEQEQGIWPILKLSASARGSIDSPRRTSSADMSSKKWRSQNLSLEMIKDPPFNPESSAAAEGSKEELERQGHFDIWSAIQSQKAVDANSSASTTYVHPLVKRSASSMSKNSLQICTESLGSESGSEGSSLSDDVDRSPIQTSEGEAAENDEETELQAAAKKRVGDEDRNCSITQKLPARSFPPPLPSLSPLDGPCLCMRPHRKDGRLVLEAVPTRSYNHFHAQRQGGRLLLTVVNTPLPEEKVEIEENYDINEEEVQVVVEEFLDQDFGLESKKVTELRPEEEEEATINVAIHKEEKFVLEVQVTPANRSTSGVVMVHRLALVLDRTVSDKPVKNQNPWDEMSGRKREERKVVAPFNAYDCCWRSCEHPFHLTQRPFLLKGQNFLLVTRCKEEPSKPLLLLEPRCIAT